MAAHDGGSVQSRHMGQIRVGANTLLSQQARMASILRELSTMQTSLNSAHNHEQVDFFDFVKARHPSTRMPVDGECVPQEQDRGHLRIHSAPDSRCAYGKL